MADHVRSIKGVSQEMVDKLAEHKITNVDHLLETLATPQARRDMAKSLGITPAALTDIVNRADLSRLHGVGTVFADLLEEAGVDSVKELAHRVAANLHPALEKANAEHKLTSHVPTLAQVEAWVAHAKELMAAGKAVQEG